MILIMLGMVITLRCMGSREKIAILLPLPFFDKSSTNLTKPSVAWGDVRCGLKVFAMRRVAPERVIYL
jgi:hypothetical protein